jgi:tetratricopeptide (TPR) repeat protein
MTSVIGGSAGVGKTALALHWAHQVAHRFPDGQLYVDLRGYGPSGTPVTPAGAICGFLDALGVPAGQVPAEVEAKAGLYRSLLSDRRMLIVLDNARDEQQVRPLLPGGRRCVVLVTSRSHLATAEGAHQISLDVFTQEEARELLARRLGAAQVAADPAAVADLIRHCARLPLALSIVATRGASYPGLSVSALASELRDAKSRLDTLDTADMTTSVRPVFSWSCQRLNASAARMFRLLGLHPGPEITAAAAASLAALPVAEARQALRELTRARLLEERIPGRFTFHDLLRAYSAEQATALEDPSGRATAMHRMLDHYLHTASGSDSWLCFAEHLAPRGPPWPGTVPEHLASREEALGWFTAEHRVLLRVISLAADRGFDAYAWQLPPVLWRFFALRGQWDDWASTHQIALAAAQRLDDRAAQALTHRNLGAAFIQLGSFEDAQAHLRQALNLYRRANDPAGQAACHLNIARILEQYGGHRQAWHHAHQAFHLYQAVGETAGQAYALTAGGRFDAQLGNLRVALTYYRRALALHREVGNRFGEALTLDSLASHLHQAENHSQAIALYQEALTAYRDAGDRYYHVQTLIHLAETHDASGNPQSAQRARQQALAILDHTGHLNTAGHGTPGDLSPVVGSRVPVSLT